VALAHHDAAGRDQGCGGKAEFVGAQQRADHDVASGAEAAVDLDHDPAAQPLAHQGLVGFGEADFPGTAGVLDRGQRRGAGAAFEAGDGDVIGARFGNAGRDRAHADLRDQLDRYLAVRIDVLQIVDQLRQILDRIDVVMRRRRNQADAGRRMPHPRNHGIDLVAGNCPPSPGFGALRHLDLHHVGVDEIFGGDAEAARGDLLDRRAHRIAVRHRLEAIGFLAALAGVRLAPIRFIAIARVVWASREIEPNDIAPVAKRLTISLAGSTWSSGTGLRFSSSADLILNRPRSVNSRSDCSLRIFANPL